MKRWIEAVSDLWHTLLFAVVAALSVAAFTITQQRDLLFIYDDGVSYLTIARSVFDNMQPGLEQIGSIWLPLSHILKLPFVWNDFLFHSSLAGSILSMMSYVALCVFVYKTVVLITKNQFHGTAAAAICAANPALLFLQSTAMSEVPFIALFSASVYYFVQYINTRSIRWLTILGLINAAMILVRYEGWFVVLVQAALIVVAELARRVQFREMATRVVLFGLPVALAVVGWLLWNNKLTGDPLYFMRGEFSASEFTDRQQAFGVQTEGSVGMSLVVYMAAAVGLVGIPAVIVASFGQAAWLLNWFRTRADVAAKRMSSIDFNRAAIVIVLLSPALFHVITMFGGMSIMRVAGVAGDTTSLNVRYGIFLLPYIAIGIAMLSRRALVVAGLTMIVLVSYVPMVTGDMLIIDDALEGQVQYRDAAVVLRNNVRSDDTVLVSMATNAAFTFHSNLPLSTFVHEGVSERWSDSVDDPSLVDWVVTSEYHEFGSLAELDKETQLADFHVFYENEDITLYRKLK